MAGNISRRKINIIFRHGKPCKQNGLFFFQVWTETYKFKIHPTPHKQQVPGKLYLVLDTYFVTSKTQLLSPSPPELISYFFTMNAIVIFIVYIGSSLMYGPLSFSIVCILLLIHWLPIRIFCIPLLILCIPFLILCTPFLYLSFISIQFIF